MRPDDLRDLLRRHPFQPLRLHLTNGIVFEIGHPDMAVVERSTIKLILPSVPGTEREAVIALLHVVWVETIILTAGPPTS
ncbi:MAG TPA: hypothetical protein VNK04_12630 [Gemmataceae bacterium]|nr:hypothetical protein [Gemmataceae bacterium]